MKLIALQIIPDSNQAQQTAIVTIDHAPGEFKSAYVTLAKGRDGAYHLTSIPPNIDAPTLAKASAFAQNIIDTVLTALEGVLS